MSLLSLSLDRSLFLVLFRGWQGCKRAWPRENERERTVASSVLALPIQSACSLLVVNLWCDLLCRLAVCFRRHRRRRRCYCFFSLGLARVFAMQHIAYSRSSCLRPFVRPSLSLCLSISLLSPCLFSSISKSTTYSIVYNLYCVCVNYWMHTFWMSVRINNSYSI